MSFKRKTVVMIPTNVSSGKLSIGNTTGIMETHSFSEMRKEGIYKNHKFYHLYIASDERPRNGDWILEKESIINQFPDYLTDIEECRKIIASTDKSLGLPEPSQGFIKKYVSEYNKGSIIKEVLVEYNDYSDYNPSMFPDFILKVSKDNTITIKKIKDSWSREELRSLFLKMCHDTSYYLENVEKTDSPSEFNVDKWIEENL